MTAPDLNILAHAQTLIKRLQAPAQWHSVWVRARMEDGIPIGGHELCVSIRPEHASKIKVPKEHQGIPVVQVPWPEEG